jgi:tetratricopeptide (TPR) repeat protein
MATNKTNKMSYLLCLWPGSGGVLRQGRWSFLMIALLYGFALCGVVMLNFYWSELLTENLRRGTYAMLVVLWLVLSNKSSRLEKQCHRMRLPPPPDKDALPDAQQHYLQGNWFEAECCLNMLLKKNPRDIEAMLMLATLYRHKERYDEAGNLLRELERLEDALPWKFEIRSEKRKLMAANAKRLKKSKSQPVAKNSEQDESEKYSKKCERQEDTNDDNEYADVSKRQLVA